MFFKAAWTRILIKTFACACLLCSSTFAQETNETKQREFFENKIRPVLVEHCYECHNSIDTAESGLALDHRQALIKGGDGGAVVVPGKPDKSRMLLMMRHEIDGMEMPMGAPKLDARILTDFEKWIKDGAFDPRDKPPSKNELDTATAWETKFAKRKQWWSLQPITYSEPPQVDDLLWNNHPIDQFVSAKLVEQKLEPAPLAEPAVLVRRLFINLIGLPPTPEEATRWTKRLTNVGQNKDTIINELVDNLLARPQFGQRWARHWMDWIRYAESHGSEGDPAIVGASAYRDYLVRAINDDVSIKQLITEHVAGDLLTDPRINNQLGINESIIGTAHWRMVFHGFAPTDALDEKVRFIDDQVNVFSKAFLGLTVSCARCHDHKFDAISQKDYYALYGILASCRPGRNVIDLPQTYTQQYEKLQSLKPKIRTAIANDWLKTFNEKNIRQHINKEGKLLELAKTLRPVTNGDEFVIQYRRQKTDFQRQLDLHNRIGAQSTHWDLSQSKDHSNWYNNTSRLSSKPNRAGQFALNDNGESVLTGIYPAGVYSHLLSNKTPARFTSPDVQLDQNMKLWVHAAGGGAASLRYVVQDYPRNGTVYPVGSLNNNNWRWLEYDLSYWKGDAVHVELATNADQPLLAGGNARSWFGVREVRLIRAGGREPKDIPEFLGVVFNNTSDPTSIEQLLDQYSTSIRQAILAWQKNETSDAQALLLDQCLREGLLPNTLDQLKTVRPLIESYREIESTIPVPRRVPGLDESIGTDHPLLVRGNHKKPGEPVARSFISAIDDTPYKTNQSGRLQLANDVLRNDNPLTRRVMVNRIWHHLFGRGIVDTPDNLGIMGEPPSHPHLLDWLATHFDQQQNWSLKKIVRTIVTSRTWQLSSTASPRAAELDPNNRLLSHANMRRMDAETIRDQMLMLSGQLKSDAPNGSVKGDAPYRSLYVRVQRNDLDPFLRAFDFPEPFAAVGRRDSTNVPAQSLMLLNDPKVAEHAKAWAQRASETSGTDSDRINQMFLAAFGRTASEDEINRSLKYMNMVNEQEQQRQRLRIVQQTMLDQSRKQISEITEPVRKRLLNKQQTELEKLADSLPQPIAAWEFANSVNDIVGNIRGELHDGAKIENDAIVVSGGGYLVTQSLHQDIRAKTLEAWVQLDNLDQRAGGVISVQTSDGRVFDAIVFAEQEPGKWMAGSDFFKRTKSLNGPIETKAHKNPVHIAIVYHEDGRIEAFRNGEPYGKPYKTEGPVQYKAGDTVVTFGLRHLPANPNKMLSGKIFKANLYDRALTHEQIAASAKSFAGYIPESRILAELTEEDRKTLAQLKAGMFELESKLEQLDKGPSVNPKLHPWNELARAIFIMKEFIYVR